MGKGLRRKPFYERQPDEILALPGKRVLPRQNFVLQRARLLQSIREQAVQARPTEGANYSIVPAVILNYKYDLENKQRDHKSARQRISSVKART